MFAQILGETTCGIDGVQILVEVDVSNGLPSFDLVGLPAMAVRESKERNTETAAPSPCNQSVSPTAVFHHKLRNVQSSLYVFDHQAECA